MEITYIPQPNGSKQCGQTVLAMLLGTDIKTICKEMKKSGGTRNSHLKKILDSYNIKYRYKRCKHLEHIPKVAIVKIGFAGYSHTHWTLKYEDFFYDPTIGVIKEYNKELIEPISYLEIL